MDSFERLTQRIAFAGYRNINLGTARRFLSLGIDEEGFFSKEPSLLAAITGLRPSFFDDSRRREALETAKKEAAFVRNKGIGVHYFADADSYPGRLNECDDAPAILFSLGCAAPAAHSVAIVGTRHCTSYGVEFTRKLVGELGEALDSLTIVSGLAYGIDIAAHRAAMSSGVHTGAVLAHGLNTIYPADHRDDAQRMVRQGGFVMTEYTSQASVHRGNFLSRNRIVAALADVTVVVESDTKGGAMTTARIADAYNREVMALPGRVTDTYSRGCNGLIARSEANIIRGTQDLLDLLGWASKPLPGAQQELPFLSPEQTAISDFLKKTPDVTVNDMCSALGMPYSRLSAMLFEMEMDNIVCALPGGRYCLINPDV